MAEDDTVSEDCSLSWGEDLGDSRYIDLDAYESIPDDDYDQPFVKSATLVEMHRKPIYACSFNPYLEDPYIFATVAADYVNIYEAPLNKSQVILRRSIKDPSPDETYYAVCWTYDTTVRRHRLVVGGMYGVLRVIDAGTGEVVQDLRGHGDLINEVRTSPNNSNLVASVSKDNTLRMWNIRVPACLAIFGGYMGHRDQVLSLDWSSDSRFLVSSSMDHSIRLWNASTPEIKKIIDKSMSNDHENLLPARYPNEMDKVVMVNFPIAWNNDMHADYVDCVRFIGEYIVAKSSEEVISLFRFGDFGENLEDVMKQKKPDTACMRLAKLELTGADIWFIKFEIDPLLRWIVGGTKEGKLMFWDISEGKFTPKADITLPVCECTIRNVAFGGNGRIMIAVADDASITRIDRFFLGEHSQRKMTKSAKGKGRAVKQSSSKD